MDRSLIEQAIADTQSSAQKSSPFLEVFVQTGLADSLLWLVVGIAIGKWLL